MTILEIAITAVLIALAMALAIPQLVGTSTTNYDNQAQNTAQSAITAAAGFYRDAGAFPTASTAGAAQLSGVDPELTYATAATTASTGPTNVSFASSGSVFAVAVANCTTSGSSCAAPACWFERKNLGVSHTGGAAPTDAVDLFATQPATASGYACTGTNALTINTGYVPATPADGAAWSQPLTLP